MADTVLPKNEDFKEVTDEQMRNDYPSYDPTKPGREDHPSVSALSVNNKIASLDPNANNLAGTPKSASDIMKEQVAARDAALATKKTEIEAKNWFQGWVDKIEEEKRRALQRVESRRLGTTLSSIGRSIGDMIQSTNNAPILPYDIQKQYDELGRQEQLAYDTYFNRMDALRKAKAAQDLQREAQEREDNRWNLTFKQQEDKRKAENYWKQVGAAQKERELDIKEDENERKRQEAGLKSMTELIKAAMKAGKSEPEARAWAMKASGKYKDVIISNGKVFGADYNSGESQAWIEQAYQKLKDIAGRDSIFSTWLKKIEKANEKSGIVGAEIKHYETVLDALASDNPIMNAQYREMVEGVLAPAFLYTLDYGVELPTISTQTHTDTDTSPSQSSSNGSSSTGGAY